MRRVPVFVVLVAALVACERIGSGGSTQASKTDSLATLNAQLAQAHTVNAQQDSLLQGFQQTTQLLADMDKELSKVKGLHSHVPLDVKTSDTTRDPQAAYRASLLGKVQEVTTILAKSRARVAALSSQNTTLRAQLKQYDSTITNLQALLEQNKEEIATLTGRVDSLSTANTLLTTANAAEIDTVKDLRKQTNTVYYVVGTKQDLMKRGIIVEEGSKFLFFGHRVLVPARTLDPSAFTAIDKWEDTPIALHVTNKPFKIVSRHDPALIEAPRDSAGHYTGEIHIAQPGEFWTTSKYLIIVEGA